MGGLPEIINPYTLKGQPIQIELPLTREEDCVVAHSLPISSATGIYEGEGSDHMINQKQLPTDNRSVDPRSQIQEWMCGYIEFPNHNTPEHKQTKDPKHGYRILGHKENIGADVQ